MSNLRIGIRKSRMMTEAARGVEDLLLARNDGLSIEWIPFEPEIRYSADSPESYVKELEEHLHKGDLDLALHFLKEIPVILPEGISLLSVTPRMTPFDAFVSPEYGFLDEVPEKARIGVTHPRQVAQLRSFRFDIETVEIHGSVDSRLQQMQSQKLAGLLISAESLERLGMQDKVTEMVQYDVLLPSPGQGCLGLLGMEYRERVVSLATSIEDSTSRIEATAERAFLEALGGNPEIPAGVLANLDSRNLIVEGFLGIPDGSCQIRDSIQGPGELADELGCKLAELLLVLGDDELQTLIPAKI